MLFRRIYLISAFSMLVPAIGASENVPYDLDTAHSILSFSIALGGVTSIRGTFDEYRGTVMVNEDEFIPLSATVLIDVHSINTGIDMRDGDLKGPKFFDAEKHAWIRYQSRGIEKKTDGFLVVGDLTLHGVSKSIEIRLKLFSPERTDPWGNRRITLVGGASLNRKDFGIDGPRFWSEALSDRVDIELVASASILNYDKIRFSSHEKKSIGELMWETVSTEGVEAAQKQFRELRRDSSEGYNFSLREVLLVGLKLRHQNRLEEAIAVWEMAAEAYAGEDTEKRAEIYALLAQAYVQQGHKEKASQSCEKALELDPNRTDATEILRSLKRSQ